MRGRRGRFESSTGLAAVLSLNFTSGTLDSRITFSRPSLATMYDSTGKLTYAPNNLLTSSNTFSAGVWALGTMNVASGVADPSGGSTAWTITATAPNAIIYQTYTSTIGTVYLNSIYIRRRTGTGTVIFRYPNNTNRDVTAEISSSWTRITSYLAATGSTSYFVIQLATSGDAVDIAWGQAEAVTYQTTPSTYVATTSAAYYGPRFDYNPSTLAARGLLIEESRTNIILQSNDAANAAWTNNAITPTANNVIGMFGTQTAAKLTPTVANGQHYNQQGPFTVGSGATLTHWRILKNNGYPVTILTIYDSSHHAATFNLSTGLVTASDTGVTASISLLNNGWYLCSVTYTITGTSAYASMFINSNGNYTGDGTSGIYQDFAQFEVGSFQTSAIPTGSSSVARSADSATITGSNFSSWYNQNEGSFVIGITTAPGNSGFASPLTCYLNGTNRMGLQFWNAGSNSRGYNFVSSVVDVDNSLGAWTYSTFGKYAHAYKINDFATVKDGGSVVTDTSGASFAAVALDIGSGFGGLEPFNGWIKTVDYYRTRLSNTRLQALTQ